MSRKLKVSAIAGSLTVSATAMYLTVSAMAGIIITSEQSDTGEGMFNMRFKIRWPKVFHFWLKMNFKSIILNLKLHRKG